MAEAKSDVERLMPILRLTVNDDGITDEITGLIDAAKQELVTSNIKSEKAESTSDPLIWRAICLYVKANFGYDNPDADRLMENFKSLVIKLGLDKEYRVVAEDEV